jgi:predicted amidohydrolase
MMRIIRVAAAQMGPTPMAQARPQTLARLVRLLEEAASQGATLVVFPELALTTFRAGCSRASNWIAISPRIAARRSTPPSRNASAWSSRRRPVRADRRQPQEPAMRFSHLAGLATTVVEEPMLNAVAQ